MSDAFDSNTGAARTQAPPVRSSPVQQKRKTIGVLIDFMDLLGGGYQTQLRRGFEASSRRLDLNLILVFGRSFDHTAHSVIYELITRACVDGVILTSSLAAQGGVERLQAWLKGRPSLPLCCAGFPLPGVPSVVVDNRPGMRAVIEHLIAEHRCRMLAFLGGPPQNPDAELRYGVYRDALRRHGLEFDPRRVADGHFVRREGERAMLQIIDRGVDFDSVVAANDGMALGAIEALRSRGFRVPRDIPVTGFDDMEWARLGHPPLTTVRQPVESIAETAVELLADRLCGREVAPIVELTTERLIRQSCGCHRPSRSASGREQAGSPAEACAFISTHEERLGAGLGTMLDPCRSTPVPHGLELVTALRAQLGGKDGAFDSALEDVVEDIRQNNELHQALQAGIGWLRDELRDFATPDMVEIWDAARSRIALANTYSQAQQRYAMNENYERWVGFGEQVAAAFDFPSLRHRLIAALGSVGMSSFVVSLFAAESPSELQPYLGVLDGQLVACEVSRYSADLLFPPGFLPTPERRTWVVYPLAFEDQRLGVAIFEHGDRGNGYQILCDQISAALKNASLHLEIVSRTLLHERSVQERLATAQRLQSLSVLAGGVAHDLNNALGPLVALPDIMLDELARLEVTESATLASLKGDMDSIRTASLRAAETIKDLLTLGRQGRTSKEPLELNRIIANCLANEPLRSLSEAAGKIHVTLDLWQQPLMVLASESHLMRAFSNLLRNAAEAIADEGTITIKSALARLAEPMVGYETIEPGEYVLLTVSDTGAGIGAQDLGRVFEPFFSKKKVGDHSGTGLGLAIVHGVVKEHDGFVDVISQPGDGTSFALYFPRLEYHRESYAPSSAPPQGQARILVVDDEPVQLRTARRVLVHLGYEVETLSVGKQARELFVEAAAALRSSGATSVDWRSPFDVVMLDMILADGENGLRVLADIRRLFPNQRAIMVSGGDPSEQRDLPEWELPWLTKPYTADALARAMRALLSKTDTGA